jgi:sugar/nucleoside kinase (ribokinase family)
VEMISFGLVFLELVFGRLDRLPMPGEEVFSDEFAISCGGAITSATVAAAAGVKAGLCTMLGDDVGSQVVTEHCAAAGVDVSPSVRVQGPTAGITVVLNFDGDRGFVTHLPSAAVREQAEVERWRQVLRAERPAWCYLHAGRRVPPFLREARELGCKIMLDTSLGDARDRETIIECVRLADVFVPNADELLRLTGATELGAAITAAQAWGTELVVTRGAAGAIVISPAGPVTEIAEGVGEVTVRDLTGAGDSFAGAMIAALLGGATTAEAAVHANAAGSEAVGRLGGVGSVAGGATGAGWPLRPMVLADLATALVVAGQPDASGPGQPGSLT